MSSKYVLKVEDKFSAAHKLVGYPGDCSGLHGHTFKVVASFEYTELDDLNMAVDFRTIKEILRPIIARVDHTYLNDILESDQPTAELLAEWIYRQVRVIGAPVVAVMVWESDKAGVEYSE